MKEKGNIFFNRKYFLINVFYIGSFFVVVAEMMELS